MTRHVLNAPNPCPNCCLALMILQAFGGWCEWGKTEVGYRHWPWRNPLQLGRPSRRRASGEQYGRYPSAGFKATVPWTTRTWDSVLRNSSRNRTKFRTHTTLTTSSVLSGSVFPCRCLVHVFTPLAMKCLHLFFLFFDKVTESYMLLFGIWTS